MVVMFLDMVFEEKLWPISKRTHIHLDHGIWMRDEENMPPHKKGGPLVEKNMKETFCCLVSNTLHPMNVLYSINKCHKFDPCFELDENAIQIMSKNLSYKLAQISTKKFTKSTTWGNILFV